MCVALLVDEGNVELKLEQTCKLIFGRQEKNNNNKKKKKKKKIIFFI